MMTLSIFPGGLHWPSLAKPAWRVGVAAGLAIGIIGAIVLLWASHQAATDAPRAPAVANSSAGAPPAVQVTEPQSDKLAQSAAEPPPMVDIFAPRTWQPPPPPQSQQEVVPEPPQAPPLPFRLIGRFIERGVAPVFMLAEGERIFAVRVGDRIGDSYRVEKIENSQLVFHYRPMNVNQNLAVGDLP